MTWPRFEKKQTYPPLLFTKGDTEHSTAHYNELEYRVPVFPAHRPAGQLLTVLSLVIALSHAYSAAEISAFNGSIRLGDLRVMVRTFK